jgi:hypothetical protein
MSEEYSLLEYDTQSNTLPQHSTSNRLLFAFLILSPWMQEINYSETSLHLYFSIFHCDAVTQSDKIKSNMFVVSLKRCLLIHSHWHLRPFACLGN